MPSPIGAEMYVDGCGIHNYNFANLAQSILKRLFCVYICDPDNIQHGLMLINFKLLEADTLC